MPGPIIFPMGKMMGPGISHKCAVNIHIISV